MKGKIFPVALFAIAAIVLLAVGNPNPKPEPPEGTTYLEPSPQRSGDAAAGYQYLLYGDFVSSGVPLKVFKRAAGSNSPDDLDRRGDADGIPFMYNVVTASNGVKVVAPTCLSCHAERLNGQIIVGLGNNTFDHTRDATASFQAADLAVQFMFGEKSPEWAAYQPYSRAGKAISPYIRMKTRGPNPADKIFATLAARRRAGDLAWLDSPQFDVPLEAVPTDVPAWWLVKKKNALYYNGLGRGDFARLSTASGLLTMRDTAEANRIDIKMPDILAWIRSIEAPKYPYPIDQNLAAEGKKIFEKRCSRCHGTYGDSVSYPNLLVSLEKIGTDSLLSSAYQFFPEYHTWYNSSWYAQGPHRAQLLPNRGYVAPPLDGIWATAPYLHNASVPTLEDLLNSPQRPVFWKRIFENTEANYDKEKIGWKYSREISQTDSETYDTTLPGYGNGGHKFGDRLTVEERRAVIEYLKSL